MCALIHYIIWDVNLISLLSFFRFLLLLFFASRRVSFTRCGFAQTDDWRRRVATADPGVFRLCCFLFIFYIWRRVSPDDCLVFVRALDGIWIHSLSRGVLGINRDSEDADVERGRAECFSNAASLWLHILFRLNEVGRAGSGGGGDTNNLFHQCWPCLLMPNLCFYLLLSFFSSLPLCLLFPNLRPIFFSSFRFSHSSALITPHTHILWCSAHFFHLLLLPPHPSALSIHLHSSSSAGTDLFSNCTEECKALGHSDRCWMPSFVPSDGRQGPDYRSNLHVPGMDATLPDTEVPSSINLSDQLTVTSSAASCNNRSFSTFGKDGQRSQSHHSLHHHLHPQQQPQYSSSTLERKEYDRGTLPYKPTFLCEYQYENSLGPYDFGLVQYRY